MITLKNINKVFKDGDRSVEVLKPLDLTIQAGDFIAIVGPSGSGKSTLLTIMGALQKPTQGSIVIAGEDVTAMVEKERSAVRFTTLGFILQASNLIPFFTVYEHFEFKLKQAHVKDYQSRIASLLESLDIAHLTSQYPDSLSGGERQRVAIGMALVLEPKVILADEPTASLDTQRAIDVVATLRKVSRDTGTAVIMVTHDLRMIETCDAVYEMRDGQLSKQ